jgi:aspartate ammonia-lyase
MGFRREHDSLGEKDIPEEVYFGIQTQRALENFPVSGIGPHPDFVRACAFLKIAAAHANRELGLLEKKIADAIIRAGHEVVEGKLLDQFVVDVFQAGAGTSHHMNVNEVLANRAIELLGGNKGDYSIVHPNDHVNMGQSTNDVFPTAMRIAVWVSCENLIPVLKKLEKGFQKKGKEFDSIVKSGRTHLQDASPIRLGQEFKAYSRIINRAVSNIEEALESLKELSIGGSAVGTGLNTDPAYREKVVERLSELTAFDFQVPQDMREEMESMAPFVKFSGALKLLAIELTKIANDLRLMSSGPKTGLSEINLPPVQPGSSIMPGKVNPVMAEALNMVCFQVIGNDLTVSMAAQAGQLELNVMMPVIIYNILYSIDILENILKVFTEKCLAGITANSERCRDYVEKSMGLAAALNPHIGYEKAAEIAKEANRTGKTIRELLIEKKIFTKEQVDRILDIRKMTEPGIPGKTKNHSEKKD